MNFFEQEMRRIVSKSSRLQNPKYIGRDCIVRLNDDVTAKLSFITCGVHEKYEALQIQLINRRDGLVDKQIIRFRDLWSEGQSGENQFGMHIWTYDGKTEWYGREPSAAQYHQLARSVDEYLSAFSEPEMVEQEDEDMDMSM